MAGRFFAAIVLVLLAGIAASAPVLANVARTSEATSGFSLSCGPRISPRSCRLRYYSGITGITVTVQ